jgi:VWFA-related protein
MSNLPPTIHRWVSLTAALVLGSITLGGQTPQTGQTVFRSGTLVVPIDVRVLDNKGQPVRDLKAEDFTVLENGVKQDIRHFTALALTPEEAPDPNAPLRQALGGGTTITPQNRRLFLIILGRGRLQGPSKGLDAVLSFVRTRLLPQDLVAVMAWNRATDFSSAHERAATVIERFRTRHESIEVDLQLLYSGLSGLYAGRQIPRPIQIKIDDVFNVAEAGTREVVSTGGTDGARQAADRQLDVLQRKSEIEARAAAYRDFNTDLALGDLMSDTTMGSDFDSYVALSRQTLQDVGNVYAGVDYLRFIEGEKHILLVTENGFLLPSADHDRDVASLAADARVAIDTFQTGGVDTVMSGGFAVVRPQTGFALGALRTVSTLTGGQTSISERGTTAIDRLIHATEFGYLLGYAPKDADFDGKFRDIKVQVARKGLTLSFRRGYFAKPTEAFDPRRSIAMTRMVAAANFGGDVQDLKLTIKTSEIKVGARRSVTVDTTIPAERIVFARTASGPMAAISQAVLCLDASGRTVGEVWRTLNVRVAPENYDTVRKEGLKIPVTLDVTASPSMIRVIVYDYGSDLLGSTYMRKR